MLEGSDGVSGASGTFTQTQVVSWICPHEHSLQLSLGFPSLIVLQYVLLGSP